MRMTTATGAERRPHRSRLDHPDPRPGSFRRGELAAGLTAVAVLAQLALAPVSLLVAGVLVLTGRISRWQLSWLLVPALGGACWLAVAGLPAVAHALAAGAGRLMVAELAVGAHPKRLLHPAAAFAGSGRWLQQELPLLVLAGTAEAAIVLWPHRTGRPGLVAVLRRRSAAAALAAGHTVTASGFRIGVDCRSGRLAAVSWAQAERGVLLTGGDPIELDQIGLVIACAAVRRRKAVLVLDLAGAGVGSDDGPHGRASVCAQVARLAERVGVPVMCIGSVADRVPAVPGARTSRAVSLNGSLGRAIRGRSVVLVPPHQPAAAQPETTRPEVVQHAVSDLVGTLTSLRELGLRGDCLAWLSGCEAADPGLLSDLLALGHATGTAVVLSATSAGLAADLAAEAGLVVASGPVTGNLAERLADLAIGTSATGPAPGPAARAVAAKLVFTDILRGQHRKSATLIAGSAISGPVSFRIVPIEATEVR